MLVKDSRKEKNPPHLSDESDVQIDIWTERGGSLLQNVLAFRIWNEESRIQAILQVYAEVGHLCVERSFVL